MTLFRSLAAKYIFISVILLLFFALYTGGSFYFTNVMEGDARKINVAGRERMLTYRIASHLHFIAQSPPSAERELHARGVETAMDEYEDALLALAGGSVKLGLEPLHVHDGPSRVQLDELTGLWKNVQRPLLRTIIRQPLRNVKETCEACHAAVRENLPKIEALVKRIEEHHERELLAFDLYRFSSIVLLVAILISLVVYAVRSLIRPARELRAAAADVERGNFDVSVAVRTADEMGTLGLAFNSMARRLKDLFAEKEEHLHELNMLNEISLAASKTLELKVMLDKVMDAILSLAPLTLLRKGAVLLFDEDKKVLEMVVSRNFDEEQARLCASVDIGECLCGLCAKQEELVLSEASDSDRRHTKTYTGMKTHGHVVLPLKARNKLLGVLCFYLPAGTKLPDNEVKFYQSIADILSVSIQNALNHKQVAMLAQSLESSMDLIVIADVEGMVLHVNPQVEAYLGYTPEELKGRHISLMQAPRVAALWEDIHRATLTDGGWRGEIINITKDGREYPVLLSTSLVKYEHDNIIAMIGIVRDISDQKRAEDVVRQSERRYRLLFDLLPYGGEVLDTEGRIVDCSLSDSRLLGYERDELIGKRITELLDPRSVPVVREKFQQLLHGSPVQAEIRMVRKDGRVIDVARAAQPIRDADGNITGALALSVDITDRKKAEEENRQLQSQLLQAQKLESIGRLAGGVAHDFNNLLSVIVGYSDMLLRKGSGDKPSLDKLVLIKEAGEKAAVLTRHLLAFSRKQALYLVKIKLNSVIEDTIKLLMRMIGEDVTLKLNTRSTRTTLADPAQMEQILMNLAVNARDAMPRGGQCTIETSDIDLDEDSAREQGDMEPGPYVMLSVADNGEGMSQETRERIFEPFFTTKESGKGTGLGMSMVYGIVMQHNGHIRVSSEPGKGTTFTIYLPAVEGEAEVVVNIHRNMPSGGTETVLVVEDDPSIRSLVRDILEPLGYRLLIASSGEEALKISDNTADTIPLLLTDVILTGMNGKELADAFAAKRPDCRVIFMSGHADESLARHGVLLPGLNFIQKPLSPASLAEKIREVLDRANNEKT
ncbi:MAG: PAS domain S-box protein [Nitrospirota bacterium]